MKVEPCAINRIESVSASFLGKPYLKSGLSEANLCRLDAFDCVTYVNTVLALALSQDDCEFHARMIELNYFHQAVTYLERLHFVELDWNQKMQQIGLLQDITRQLSADYQVAKTIIDKPAWFAKQGVQLEKQSKQFSATLCELDYLPIKSVIKNERQLTAVGEQIPHAAVIEIVRPNWDLVEKIGTHLNVSHLGFAIWQDGQLLFRQASSVKGEVVDQVLTDYLHDCLESPTIKGINVQRLSS